jgi:predicted DNA-binding transcriptional regulator AlpA
MLTRRDLRRVKGIPYSRQHIVRLINEGKFPKPDGRTADRPTAPLFWFEHRIDEYLRGLPPYRRAKFPAQQQKGEAIV